MEIIRCSAGHASKSASLEQRSNWMYELAMPGGDDSAVIAVQRLMTKTSSQRCPSLGFEDSPETHEGETTHIRLPPSISLSDSWAISVRTRCHSLLGHPADGHSLSQRN